MHLEKHYLYHIYNQGNNKRRIFFIRDNYLFFLEKIKIYVKPYADILAWCLMPNHFHLMVYVNEVEIATVVDSDGVTWSHPVTAEPMQLKKRSLNQSIGIMLRSYTRAIHKQNGTSGALFRESTKAECLNQLNGITPSFYNTNSGTKMHIDIDEKQYPQICFDYIHQNPVRGNLVKNETDWEYSSARDYANLRNGKLINKERASEFIDI